MSVLITSIHRYVPSACRHRTWIGTPVPGLASSNSVCRSTRGRSSGWVRSGSDVPISSAGATPSTRSAAGPAYSTMPSPRTTTVRSEAFCTSARNHSRCWFSSSTRCSLSRTAES